MSGVTPKFLENAEAISSTGVIFGVILGIVGVVIQLAAYWHKRNHDKYDREIKDKHDARLEEKHQLELQLLNKRIGGSE